MNRTLAPGLAVLSALSLAACGGSSAASGGSAAQMDLVEVSNGFGLMLPHQVFVPDASGNPTQQLIAIRSIADLTANVKPSNPILPVTEWPVTTSLPNGDFGNHFIYAEFTQPIEIDSVLDPSPGGQANSGLLGPITVLALDPSNGQSIPVQGRAFINGQTYAGAATGTPPELQLQKWVDLDASGKPIALDIGGGSFPGTGFPGTQSSSGFSGSIKLVSPSTFVFVVDGDGDLSTHESFPAGKQIKLRATQAVKAKNQKSLLRQVLAAATVGPDALPPEVAVTPPPNSVPVTAPSFGEVDVDPLTKVRIEFTEPLQPLTLGALPSNQPPTISSAVKITFGPSTSVTEVPFSLLPLSAYDLSVWELTTAFPFPGSPAFLPCGTYTTITVSVLPIQFQDLKNNKNSFPASTHFETGEGPGLVNAPIPPDVIYAIRQGAKPGISVIDLNGFGQGTGNPTFDFSYNTFTKGNTNFPNNPNLKQQGTTIRPQLFPGTCTVDGGSEGVFTLTKDTSLNSLLIAPPVISSVSDLAIGHPLDLVFHNGNDPTGCKAGGGSGCAITGKKLISVVFGNFGASSIIQPGNLPNQVATGFANQVLGGGNPVSWAPHPNPPPLIFPPLCITPYLAADEPTSYNTIALPPPNGHGLGLSNLLLPGNPFGNPLAGLPPSGILAVNQNAYFEGPDLAQFANTTAGNICYETMTRQQVGHFLYLIDRARREVVVLNSNRFLVLERIPVPDPTDLAMGPNLDFLAVSNQNADLISFIDIDPSSSSFHKVVKSTTVGSGPRGIAWDPGNEDILVCNELDNTVSVISAFSFNVRKVVKSHLNQPFDVVITQRQFGFGFLRNVYFGWILNRNGDLTIFESGPNGVNGWGFDDTIGVASMNFDKPKKIAPDFYNLGGGVWIAHEGPLNANGTPTGVQGGAISNAFVDSAIFGILLLSGGNFGNPQFRDMTIQIQASIGPDQLTGIPVDIAFDNLVNLGALTNLAPVQAAGSPLLLNGKSYVRQGNGPILGAVQPRFMFAAIPNSSEGPGAVDVINLQSGNLRFDTDAYLPGVQSIPVPGVSAVVDYWRQ